MDTSLGLMIGGTLGILGTIYSLFILLPTLAVAVRRLHDINKSGWYIGAFYIFMIVYLIIVKLNFNNQNIASGSTVFMPLILPLLMLAYSIYLLVLLVRSGDKGSNTYGPDPYGADDLQIEDHLV